MVWLHCEQFGKLQVHIAHISRVQASQVLKPSPLFQQVPSLPVIQYQKLPSGYTYITVPAPPKPLDPTKVPSKASCTKSSGLVGTLTYQLQLGVQLSLLGPTRCFDVLPLGPTKALSPRLDRSESPWCLKSHSSGYWSGASLPRCI